MVTDKVIPEVVLRLRSCNSFVLEPKPESLSENLRLILKNTNYFLKTEDNLVRRRTCVGVLMDLFWVFFFNQSNTDSGFCLKSANDSV